MLPSREFSCGISRQGAGRGGRLIAIICAAKKGRVFKQFSQGWGMEIRKIWYYHGINYVKIFQNQLR